MQGAVDNYALAFREAETVFKGTDLRYLNTAKEADDLYRRLRQFPPAIACYQGALARLSAPKGGESFYKSMFLTRLGRAYLFAGQLNPAEETFKTGLQYTREKLSERNPYAAECLSGLAQVHSDRKQFDLRDPA